MADDRPLAALREEAELRAHVEAFLTSPLASWRPWEWEGRSPQGDFLRSAETHRARIYRGGNRTGKTSVAAVDVGLRSTGWHPWARVPKDRPPHGWIVGLDWEHGIGDVLWPALKAYLPAGTRVHYHRVAAPSIAKTIIFPGGARADFKSAEAGRDKFQGASLDWAWVDEEVPPDVVEETRMRLVDRDGDFFATLTPVRREPWVRKLEVERGTKVVEASTLDAAAALAWRFPKMLDAVRAIADTLPERQRRVRILGQHAQLEGLVYPTFSRERHVLTPRGGRLVNASGAEVLPWPLPSSWEHYAAIDFGYSNPTAIVEAYADPASGRVVVPRVHYAAFVRGTTWAEYIRHEVPPLAAHLVADHDADERAEFLARGIGTQAAKKDVIPGIECVERFLGPEGKPPRIFFVLEDPPPRHDLVGRRDALPLVQELERYHYPRKRTEDAPDRKDLPEKVDDHAADALRYGLMLLEGRFGGPPRITFAEDVLSPEELRTPAVPSRW